MFKLRTARSNSLRCLVRLGIVALLIASMVSAGVAQDKAAGGEPPLELDVAIGDQTITTVLGETAEVVIDGNRLALEIRPKPYRTFQIDDLQFRYPRGFSYSEDASDPTMVMWEFDGNDFVIMLFRYGSDQGDLTKAIAESTIEQYGQKNVETSEVSLQLGEVKCSGIRVMASLVNGIPLRQDFLSVAGESARYTLILQDSLNDERQSTQEGILATQLLKNSFQLRSKQ